jgi:hypothetical protein
LLTVGAFRIINQCHWLSDVFTGTGVAILCVETSYLMLPMWHHLFGIDKRHRKKDETSVLLTPIIGIDYYGAGMTLQF